MNARRGLALVAGAFAVCSASAAEVIGTGGMVVTNGDYVVHTFTNDDTFVFSGGEVEVLLVGGGGGGGSGRAGGGGGGAGGFVHKERLSLWKDSFPIRVGKGGKGAPGYDPVTKVLDPAAAEEGGDTEAFGLIAHGGGYGANSAATASGSSARGGGDGASGGGAALKYQTDAVQRYAGGLSIWDGEGCAGGASTNVLTTNSTPQGHVHCWLGGGGGAGEAGADGVCTLEAGSGKATTGLAGKGGDGLPCSITGEELYYAGGGGGGFADYADPTSAGTVPGGEGGGGAGSGGRTGTDPWPGLSGTDGLGGGGGGGGAFGGKYFAAGGDGGCGTVIVRYRRELPDEGSVAAEGADVSYNDDVTSVIYTFKGNGTFSVTGGVLVDVLLVGGGGGGGSGLAGGGGGGAGGFIYHQSQYVADGTYEIVVGNGGAGGQPVAGDNAATDAENGEDTQAFGLVAYGGGAGGRSVKFVAQTGTMSGKDGGSGGGAAPLYHSGTVATYSGGAACEGEGFGGGRSTNVLTSAGNQGHVHCWAGGGGGAGEAGADGICTLEAGAGADTTGQAGRGGDGLPCSITGKELYYAGGGGGGYADHSNPSAAGTVAGGNGGGGAGSGGRVSYAPWSGCDGTDGLGGGGGGGGAYVANGNAAGGKGGKGVVIVRCRYRVRPFEKVSTEGAKRSRDGDYRVYTFTNNGTITVTGDSVVDVLLVGGGGGGGSGRAGGGGGGAGGMLYRQTLVVTGGTYQVVVGQGGLGGQPTGGGGATDAENGRETTAFGLVVHGGGAGGRGVAQNQPTTMSGKDGGSGGGAAPVYQASNIFTYPGGLGISGEGFGGGCSTNTYLTEGPYKDMRGHLHAYGGGGGGAGAAGGDGTIVSVGDDDATVGFAGEGGDGLPCSITGKELYYAGGGGGGYADQTNPQEAGTVAGGNGGGGSGSGGRSGSGKEPWPGLNGTDGLGGGGGGGGAYGANNNAAGGKGGAGTVIIRCQVVPSDKGLMLLFR